MADVQQTPEEAPVIDEQPGRQREWTGALRSLVLPILAVAAIGLVIFLVQDRANAGGSNARRGGLGLVALPSALNPAGAKPAARPGRAAPDFVLQTLDGSALRLSDLRAHPVVLNFWATWCGPCRSEMPEFETVYQTTGDVGLVVLAVNVQESTERVKGWAHEFGLTFPVALDQTGGVTRGYAVGGLPMTVFIGKDGVVRSVHSGQLDRQSLLAGLAQIL